MSKFTLQTVWYQKCFNQILCKYVLGNHIYTDFQHFSIISKSAKSVSELFKVYFCNFFLHSHVFKTLEYNIWIALPLLVLHFEMSLSYYFGDLFLIIMFLALESELKLLKNEVKYLIKNNNNSATQWKVLRKNHFNLCLLCSFINKKLKFWIFLSFFSNVFLLLVNVTAALKAGLNSGKMVYYSISVLTLTFRVLCVCFSGASVSEGNNNILQNLLSMPHQLKNDEVSRICHQ